MTTPTGSGQDQYCYPGTATLINKFDIRNNDTLANAEFHVVRCAALVLPTSPATEAGFKDNHLYLYGQLYSWAGQPRMSNLTTHGIEHAKPQAIAGELAKQFELIRQGDRFTGLKPNEFAEAAAPAVGGLAITAPFRHGNDVALRYFTKHLAQRAGYGFDFKAIDPQAWVTAKQAASRGDFRPMAETLRASVAAAPAIGLRIDNAKTNNRASRDRDDYPSR
ncbi:MAG TPA: hypothetical protein VND94_18815 [Terriglobia bacterium]|nr:hypothetical protein [Terriglobia bacterium]